MKELRLRNYRCFGEIQTARLAPLTLLVGENSTGKTSFLAMVRALWDIAYTRAQPDFRESPFDLGSFDDIACRRLDHDTLAHVFEGGFTQESTEASRGSSGTKDMDDFSFDVTFTKQGPRPYASRCRIGAVDCWLASGESEHNGQGSFVGTSRGRWKLRVSKDPDHWTSWGTALWRGASFDLLPRVFEEPPKEGFNPLGDSPTLCRDDIVALRDQILPVWHTLRLPAARPFAGAPVRAEPKRTYDPLSAEPDTDPSGAHVPTSLATLSKTPIPWRRTKRYFEKFGQASGLFDEIEVKHLGDSDGDPFQLLVRKFGTRRGRKESFCNLADLGYGVGQVLPVIASFASSVFSRLYLLQQPEMHLHPMAQAALAGLFCEEAAGGNQLIVETHSDFLLDRVRMEVRDGKTELKSDDVSILYFEPHGDQVRIHSLSLDSNGNVRDVPEGYRSFFLSEIDRSLGIA